MDLSNPSLVVYLPMRDSPRTLIHEHFLYTEVGYLIQQLNSSVGVEGAQFALLVKDSILCHRCNCMFTYQGYMEHIDVQKFCYGNVPWDTKGKSMLNRTKFANIDVKWSSRPTEYDTGSPFRGFASNSSNVAKPIAPL